MDDSGTALSSSATVTRREVREILSAKRVEFDGRLPAASGEGVFAVPDRRAPGSAEEEWIAVGLRDQAVRRGAIARARLPRDARDEADARAACEAGPGAFLGWVFHGNEATHGEEGWSEESPLSVDLLGYCQFQLQVLAEAKGVLDLPNNSPEWASRRVHPQWSLESTLGPDIHDRAKASL
jgi:hypothetical protein